jgi:hypothetical protein
MKIFLHSLTQVALAQNESSVSTAKMAAGANMAYLPHIQQGPDYTWFCYGFSAALVLFSLYFLYRTFTSKEDHTKKENFISALVVFVIALGMALIVPKFIKPSHYPTEFDMRTT